jgi:signal transduction histidine kinase
VRKIQNSLKNRFILSSAASIVFGLIFTGLLMAGLFRGYINAGFHDEMQIHIEELGALVALDKTGQPFLMRRLSDPRFIPKDSGFYWQVRRAGFQPVRSPSLAGKDIPASLAISNKKNWAILPGPTGDTLEYGMQMTPKKGGPPVELSIASDMRILREVLYDFEWPLTAALLGVAVIMTILGAFQIQFSLVSVRRLESAVAGVRSGKAQYMDENYPAELQPMVSDLNKLLAANLEMVRSARVQAGNLAHGLRTPLAIVLDEALQLRQQGQRSSASVLSAECDRMRRYIDYYTARARTAAHVGLSNHTTSLASSLTPIVTALHRLHRDRRIDITVAERPDINVACDAIDLEEMLSNLIDNACKWASSKVEINWNVTNDVVEITIDDDGKGLPDEKRAVVFNAGERLDEEVPGTGLGLSIVRDIALLYRGAVTLETSPLGGLRVLLCLPIGHAPLN